MLLFVLTEEQVCTYEILVDIIKFRADIINLGHLMLSYDLMGVWRNKKMLQQNIVK